MQIKKLIPTLTEQWKTVYERERPNLAPNAITGEELAQYAQTHFAVDPVTEETYLNAVCKDVQNNAFFREKLRGAEPDPVAFRLRDGTFLGIDRVSGWFIAENDKVRDELTYVKGLDEADLENVLRTVDWLRCKKIAEDRRVKKLPPLPKKPACYEKHNAESREEER